MGAPVFVFQHRFGTTWVLWAWLVGPGALLLAPVVVPLLAWLLHQLAPNLTTLLTGLLFSLLVGLGAALAWLTNGLHHYYCIRGSELSARHSLEFRGLEAFWYAITAAIPGVMLCPYFGAALVLAGFAFALTTPTIWALRRLRDALRPADEPAHHG